MSSFQAKRVFITKFTCVNTSWGPIAAVPGRQEGAFMQTLCLALQTSLKSTSRGIQATLGCYGNQYVRSARTKVELEGVMDAATSCVVLLLSLCAAVCVCVCVCDPE